MGGTCKGGHEAKLETNPELIAISERLKRGQLTAQDAKDLDGISLKVQHAAHQLRASIIE